MMDEAQDVSLAIRFCAKCSNVITCSCDEVLAEVEGLLYREYRAGEGMCDLEIHGFIKAEEQEVTVTIRKKL